MCVCVLFLAPYARTTRYEEAFFLKAKNGLIINVFLPLWHIFLFRPRVFPRALGSVARWEPVRTPYASLGSGRGLWHVLWGFKVASPLGEGFRTSRAIYAHANPRTS